MKKKNKSVAIKSSAVKEKVFPAALIKYLESKGVDPKIIEHKTVFTAIDAANTLKRKMDEIVKSLLVKADNYYYIVCLPATHNLDFKKIKQAIEKSAGVKIKAVQITDEKLMKSVLKLKKEGMSAFGGFHKLPVILEKKLLKVKKAIFSSGSFNHSVEMAVKNFSQLENVILADFGINKKIKVIKLSSSSVKMKKGAKNKKMATKKKAKKAVKKAAPKKKAKKATKKKK